MSAYKVRLLGALVVALSACQDGDVLIEQKTEKVNRFSDLDDDGMYLSTDCMRPDGSDDCSVVPGPTECTYLEITTTTTVLVDSAGNVIREETVECTKCLADDLSVISETCSGTIGPGVICEPVDDRCWVCTSADGSVTYYECVDPVPECTSDAECPRGYHCELYPPPPCEDPMSPCPAGAETDALIVASGQCVPDDPIYCTSDAECPEGWSCLYYGSGTTDPSGSGGSDGSGGADAPIWVGGQCYPPDEPPPPECTSDADCGPGGLCVWICDGGSAGDGSTGGGFTEPTATCKGYCEYYPPPCGCELYTDAMSCESDPSCDWISDGVPCDPATGCVTPDGGRCYPAATYPTDPPISSP